MDLTYTPEVQKLLTDIATSIIKEMSEESVRTLAAISSERGLYRFHLTSGMGIRNQYNLWDKHCPLTAQWFADREAESDVYMEDGVDCHPNHPDQVSHAIMVAVWKTVRANHGDPEVNKAWGSIQ